LEYEILKFKNLKEAEDEIKKINANDIGAEIMALKAIHISIKFKDVETKTANLLKQEMLSRGGDVAVSSKAGSFKTGTTDIIILGTLAQFVRLVKKMKHQTAFDCKIMTEKIGDLLIKEFNLDLNKVEVW
jgi:dihydropteroate synthase